MSNRAELNADPDPATPSIGDRLDLHELAARYGDLIDERDWDGLDRVFTEDAVFDLADVDGPRLVGLDAIRRHMEGARHPHAHLIVNVYVDAGPAVELRSRVLGILDGRRVGSGWYRDVVVRTDRGWRVQHRNFRMLDVPPARVGSA